MKAITLRTPNAWAVIHADKDVENRTRRTHHRGQLYIHAGRTWSNGGIIALKARGISVGQAHTTAGMVIGTVDLVDCHHAADCKTEDSLCSSWALPDHWHWVLTNPQPLKEPFPAGGQLGLWNLSEEAGQ